MRPQLYSKCVGSPALGQLCALCFSHCRRICLREECFCPALPPLHFRLCGSRCFAAHAASAPLRSRRTHARLRMPPVFTARRFYAGPAAHTTRRADVSFRRPVPVYGRSLVAGCLTPPGIPPRLCRLQAFKTRAPFRPVQPSSFSRAVSFTKKGQTERSVWPAVCAICIHSKSKALYHRA